MLLANLAELMYETISGHNAPDINRYWEKQIKIGKICFLYISKGIKWGNIQGVNCYTHCYVGGLFALINRIFMSNNIVGSHICK